MDELRRVLGKLVEIEDQKTLLEGLFAYAPVAYNVFAADGRCLVVNEAFVQLFGSEPPPEYNVLKDDIVSELGIREMFERAFRGETVHTPPFWYDPRDLKHVHVEEGKRVAISLTAFPLRDSEGKVKYVVQAIRDETAEALAREGVESERDRFRAVFNSAMDGIAVLDDRGLFLEVNPAACEIYGRLAEELTGRPQTDFFADPTDTRKDWSQVKSGGHVSGQIRIMRPDGSIRDLEYQEVGRYMGERHLSIFRDSTERSRLTERLRQGQKLEAIGRLAGGVAHDFNNLLTVINGCSRMILDEQMEESVARELLEEIVKAGERAAALTRQLLAFGRQTMIKPSVLDLNVEISELRSILERLMGEGIELSTELDPGAGRVFIDPTQIEQIVINLAVNARDAMPNGGKLAIKTRNFALAQSEADLHEDMKGGDFVLMSVTDSGSGMTGETRAHLFEPFYTTKERGKGTGLGLATVYGIVKQMGGHITVYSELGMGSAFNVYIPRYTGDDAPEKNAAAAPVSPKGSETLLLVEDEAGVRKLAKATLESKGYRALIATSGEEALQSAADFAEPIDLLVTDVVMSGMTGPQLFEELQKSRPETKVLFMSGYASTGADRSPELSDSAFLHKPFTPAQLGSAVRAALDGDKPLKA